VHDDIVLDCAAIERAVRGRQLSLRIDHRRRKCA
jgi:hypothetical protein